MTRTSEKKEDEKEGAVFPIWDCGSPLYDSYELVSLTHLIERHMMALASLGGSKQINTQFYDLEDLRSSRSAGGSSIVNNFSGFLVNWVWKRKRTKEKHRKMRTGFSAFCERIDRWKKSKGIIV